MNQKTTKKIATIIAVLLVAAMILGMVLPVLSTTMK